MPKNDTKNVPRKVEEQAPCFLGNMPKPELHVHCDDAPVHLIQAHVSNNNGFDQLSRTIRQIEPSFFWATLVYLAPLILFQGVGRKEGNARAYDTQSSVRISTPPRNHTTASPPINPRKCAPFLRTDKRTMGTDSHP